MITEFYAKCNKCETEEEFTYLNVDDREFYCLRCGEKLKNEKSYKVVIVT